MCRSLANWVAMPASFIIAVLAITTRTCTYVEHKNTIGPHAEQAKHDTVSCKSADSCQAEAAAACGAANNCSTFGISPKWKEGAVAQLYSTHWNASYDNEDWTLFACASDAPPSNASDGHGGTRPKGADRTADVLFARVIHHTRVLYRMNRPSVHSIHSI